MKRIIAAVVSVAALASMAFAEDVAPVNPKAGIEFVQQVDTESVDFAFAQAGSGKLFSTDALYTLTSIKGTATYDLGNGISVTPGFKNGLEAFFDAGSGTYLLSAIRYRNRFNPTLAAQIKIVPEFNLGLAFDYRLAADISNSAAAATAAMSVNKPLENRLGGTLTGSGKIATVSYSLAQSAFCYTDVLSTNNKDDGYLELDGTYAVGTGFKLDDSLTLKLDLSDRFIYDFLSAADATNPSKYAQITNYGIFKVSLAGQEFTPYAALLLTNYLSNANVNVVNFVGGTIGADFVKGNYTVGGKYDLGVDTANKGTSSEKAHTDGHLSVYFKIKA